MAEYLEAFLDGARIDDAVFDLRPDYHAVLLAVDGLAPGPSDAAGELLLRQAETVAAQSISQTPVDQLPHIADWREAYRAFGAKPQRTRNSVEALTRRAGSGLPRVNRLTDTYNAISVLHQVPVGGEDLAARLRAMGTNVLIAQRFMSSSSPTTQGDRTC
jgi:DNA/RNA-binding domain of Phe-tRNA-synthetase-like protein